VAIMVDKSTSSLHLFKVASSIFGKDSFNIANPEMKEVDNSKIDHVSTNLIEATIIVSGMVQGPYYRTIVKNEANFQRKLVGALSENKDGTTSIIVQGNKNKIESFVRWIKKGPGLSQIVNVNSVEFKNIDELTFTGQFIEKQVLNK
jgi:acylphosphatase